MLQFFSRVLVAISMGFATNAQAISKDGRKYKVIYSKTPEKNLRKLVDVALSKQSRQFNKELKLSSTGKSSDIVATQLIEERQYEDGTIEKDYSSDALLVLDENNQQMDLEEVESDLAATASYTYFDMTGSKTKTVSNVYALNTLYFTGRYSDPLGLDLVFKVNKVTTKIVNTVSGGVVCSKIQHGYHIYSGANDYTKNATVTSPTSNTVYTVTSSHSGYYQAFGELNDQIYSFAIITLSNGSSFTLTYTIEQDDMA